MGEPFTGLDEQNSDRCGSRIRSLLEDLVRRLDRGEAVTDAELIAAHPDLMPELGKELAKLRRIQAAKARADKTETRPARTYLGRIEGASELDADALGQEGDLSDEENLPATAPAASPVRQDGSPGRVRIGSKSSLPTDSFPGYEIIREIHRGGQGVVYQAIQKNTKRKVAIKVMKEGPFAGASDKARFEREVQVLGQLNHPNIVNIHDSGEAAGHYFYVMDYISGLSLDDYMSQARESTHRRGDTSTKRRSDSGRRSRRQKLAADSALSVDSTLRLFAGICEAVNAAHLRGVIHRDLKPGNIRIDGEGEPHVLDFGLAKVATGSILDGPRPEIMTMTGQFVGSLPWASPEQAEGMPSKIDVRTDVYSLGVILYQMLTGKFPYQVIGNMRDVLDNILKVEPARPSTVRRQIDDEVETIVLKCLSKERERRYQTAGAVAEDVLKYLAGEPIAAKRDSALYLLRKIASRHAYASTLFLCAVVTLISSVFISLHFYRGERQIALEKANMAEEALKSAQFFEGLANNARAGTHRMALGWFLLEWQGDRLERAKQLQDAMPPDLPEHAVMSFLLDSSVPEEPFLAKLPAAQAALGHFAVGERRLNAVAVGAPAGRSADVSKAIEAYETCLATTGDEWLRSAAQARLRQLGRAATEREK